jgi:hypothetical protein
MSLLDDLKKEAESVKAKQQETLNAERQAQEEVLKDIRPRMRTVYHFFKEMAENLSVVEPDIRHTYDIAGAGKFSGLRQTGYRVSTPDNRVLKQLTFHFNCISEGGTKFQVRGKEAAERQRQSMWEHNLKFTSKALADGSAVFFLEPYVPVTITFEADAEQVSIRLRIRNLERLGLTTLSFSPEQVTEDMLEELGKAILRKPNRFNDMSGNRVSDEVRKQLQQQIAHDKYKRTAETGTIAPPPAGEAKKKGFIRSLFGRE